MRAGGEMLRHREAAARVPQTIAESDEAAMSSLRGSMKARRLLWQLNYAAQAPAWQKVRCGSSRS